MKGQQQTNEVITLLTHPVQMFCEDMCTVAESDWLLVLLLPISESNPVQEIKISSIARQVYVLILDA